MSTESLTALRPNLSVETKPSLFDQMSAAVVSSILLFGFLFMVLFVIWFNSMPSSGMTFPFPIPDDRYEEEKGLRDDPVEPGVEEFPEVATPQLAQTLEAVTDAVSTVAGADESRIGDADKIGRGRGDGIRRLPPPVPDQVPEYKRWVIQYEADDIDAYAKQLSFFKIDIGVIHMTENKIWRVRDVGGTAKVINSNRKKESLTLRFQHTKPRLQRWDQELCRRANVDLANTIQSQFFPQSARDKIRQAEAATIAIDGTELKQVARTTLKVVPDGEGFEFKVIDVKLR